MRLLLLLIAVLPISAARSETVRFNHSVPGKLPADWEVAMTHVGAQPDWEIVRDESAPSPPNVLAQLSRDKTAGRFPLAIWDRASLQDGELLVAFKTVDGSIDQAAGIVWRYQDSNNYYIVRANALENNVVFYKVENGVRTSIAPKGLPSRSYGVKHPIPSGRWNNLKVSFAGAKIAVFFNQEQLFEAEDTTFSKPGKVGLWTKADSVTYFDDFTVASKDAQR
ncbi:MAG TPA: family 16 glycoside hydrolase [Bryobacteraceae bacterium]|nr:family 16 glycoside hydrolase [Bryobacteraceae bacterium]